MITLNYVGRLLLRGVLFLALVAVVLGLVSALIWLLTTTPGRIALLAWLALMAIYDLLNREKPNGDA